ncbi:ABC transporter ATP-binding protein [Legionella micdadei]|uniref:Carbohydrate ABC transporter ATP-binding protein, CUT1 family (TC 3.A.1.1.-) n=1 Tax=Legionella micdadei TaxID=451 RepID=A0A098GGU5_LEGMI|nr:sn-glycerol-3-phosphate ABC transporter ATP-binding protein UgpC [Legionella micdadei]ARG97326.1 glycerol-3-phosphate ABC transporter ATP-binding protein [Legionella micdadei]ARH00365.1 glycerol-3-phosphate ABC transporter ATP-binding protein [Legionella micdadei]KTD28211.1 sn-glycerol-3-phosphate transport, ATP binding protein [Legionella micdadei]NSL16840.1 sn-glycerol-3-phosphate ABC transporter ATP-binding protein UgpC [Legionella micdadei]CEG61202.1 sn-glycerol-3-phosphate import ATP-b
MAMVNLVEVSKYHGQQLILDQINLHIDKGEFVAVVGPSGCGKSTLLRLVAGLDTVSSGKILINNQCVNDIPPAKRDMSMVFQSYALYPHMSVFDNMAYGLKMRGMKPNQIRQKVTEVAAVLQLSDYLTRKPAELSGGQRQRVAMGRAIVRSPAVFLFDEPLSNLDAKLRSEMRHEIKKLHRQFKTTSLYVTHDQIEAMTMASRILVLNKGKVEQIDSPQNLYQRPASLFVAGFIGHYPINFLPARINLNCQKVITDIGIELPLPKMSESLPCGEEVILGVRPEHLNIAPRNKEDAILVKVEYIDDMGADKLVQVVSQCGMARFAIRTSTDIEVIDNQLALELVVSKANLFHHKTGLRLGGWHG